MLSLGLADRIVLFIDMPYHFMIRGRVRWTAGA